MHRLLVGTSRHDGSIAAQAQGVDFSFGDEQVNAMGAEGGVTRTKGKQAQKEGIPGHRAIFLPATTDD